MDSQNKGAASVSIAINYIDSLTSRFENAERHINEDIEQIERRLQQLVELVRTVSVVQQNVTTQQELILKLRDDIKDNFDSLSEVIGGVDSKYSKQLLGISKKIADALLAQSGEQRKISKTIGTIEGRMQTWLNRGVGGWAVLVLVLGIFQYVGLQYINGLQSERDAAHASIAKMVVRISDLESRQQGIEHQHDLIREGTGATNGHR